MKEVRRPRERHPSLFYVPFPEDVVRLELLKDWVGLRRNLKKLLIGVNPTLHLEAFKVRAKVLLQDISEFINPKDYELVDKMIDRIDSPEDALEVYKMFVKLLKRIGLLKLEIVKESVFELWKQV